MLWGSPLHQVNCTLSIVHLHLLNRHLLVRTLVFRTVDSSISALAQHILLIEFTDKPAVGESIVLAAFRHR